MDPARLILVEGMIGSGKTTALGIGDCLAGRGEIARVFREAAVDHPIQTRAEDRLRACGHAAGDFLPVFRKPASANPHAAG